MWILGTCGPVGGSREEGFFRVALRWRAGFVEQEYFLLPLRGLSQRIGNWSDKNQYAAMFPDIKTLY